MQRAGIILCGGRSTRMGHAKATLPFGPELMLQRVARLLGSVVDSLVVVAAPQQDLPPLPAGVQVVSDRREGRGPLEGLLAGFAGLEPAVEMVYATSCDVPLLAPGFVARMFELLGDADIAAPRTEGFAHPLAAVYRRTVAGEIEALLAADRLRPAFLFERVPTRFVGEEALRDVDPELRTLRNVNRPEDYLAALAEEGFEPPAWLGAGEPT